MNDAEAQALVARIAANGLHYDYCRGFRDGGCDCTAYEDVEAVVEHLVS